jgi:hypothetical protein
MPINEKVELAKLLSARWNDPGNTLNMTIIGSMVASIAGAGAAFVAGQKGLVPPVSLGSLNLTGKQASYALMPVPLLSILAAYDLKHKLTPAAPNQAKCVGRER